MRRLVVLVLLLVPCLQALPSQATATGTVVVHCTALFPVVPAPAGRFGTCNGAATVVTAGLDAVGLPYSVNGTGAFASAWAYNEPCFVNGQPGVFLSFAAGVVTIGPLPAEHPLGVPTTATVTTPFTWTRIGLHPVITTAGGAAAVTFANGGTAGMGPGLGTATFAPPTNYDPFVHQCGVGGPANIDVIASVSIPL